MLGVKACVSPPVSSEMLKIHQQLECLQEELCAHGGGSTIELQV